MRRFAASGYRRLTEACFSLPSGNFFVSTCLQLENALQNNWLTTKPGNPAGNKIAEESRLAGSRQGNLATVRTCPKPATPRASLFQGRSAIGRQSPILICQFCDY